MAKSPDQSLQGLQLSAEEVRKQNPKWSEEMVLDYVGKQEDIKMIAEATSKILFPMIVASLKRDMPQVSIMQGMAQQQAAQLVQSIQQTKASINSAASGYARVSLSTFIPAIPAGDSVKVTGLSGAAKGFTITSDRITSINSGFVRVSAVAEVDTDTADYVTIQIRKNGATIEDLSVLSAGGTEKKPICLSFSDSANKNDYYEMYFNNPAGAAVTLNVSNIIFSAEY